jgi:polyadenylate-binding protein
VLEIDILKSQSERGAQEDNPNFTNLFVSGLEPGMTQKDLQQLFEKFGEIDSCTLKDGHSQVGYVSYKKHEDAVTAVEKMNKHQLPNGGCLIVSRFIYKQENQLSKEGQLTPIAKNMKKTFDNNIFVNYLPLDVTEDQVKETFEVTGKVLQLRLNQKGARPFKTA